MKRNTWFRRLALLLLVALLPLNGPALAEQKLDVYVRAIVPGEKAHDGCIGHYDLVIKGKLKYGGNTYVNPTISYHSSGKVYIFSEKYTNKFYPHSQKDDHFYGCTMYSYHITTGNAQTLKSLFKCLYNSSTSVKANSYGFCCKLKKSNAYSKYCFFSENCFTAVALWLNKLGDSRLIGYIGNKPSMIQRTLPSEIVKRFSGFKKVQ